uniref:Type-4 uracil-DNA glycosylase n=1 Tax=uncultured Candidatus Melainabacteria bacterium TaxID=2682970 RepID=A0A650EJG1_9BACT|nr:uracil-DNA glycosylase [uncultured Candidatus Melainabacteria bacterium]
MIKKGCLDIVQAKCESCKDCVLGNTRKNVVFSDGNPETAQIVLIGEAPGETEDETGTPFVGRAGKLLNQFLEEAGISRQDDLYIINTVKCRPPENRVPTDVEKALCERYLTAQIDIMNPKAIIFCGATSLKSFWADKKVQISKVRGNWFEVEINGKQYKAMAIFHPSYLLRNHSMEEGSPRRLMQQDLAVIKSEILGDNKVTPSNPFNKELAMV